jgi:apolipoprotein D and lipocalin family protein
MKAGLFAMFVMMLGTAMGNSKPPLETVRSVDLKRYLGKWYEIARYPNRFEKKCVSDVTANYTLREDGKITVLNSCVEKDGKINQSKGTAKVVDRNSNAKLKVTFFWPFYGNYWIIGLDPEYRFAVVSEPGRKYLWILSRTPQMEPKLYESALRIVRDKGLEPSRLIQPAQKGSGGS